MEVNTTALTELSSILNEARKWREKYPKEKAAVIVAAAELPYGDAACELLQDIFWYKFPYGDLREIYISQPQEGRSAEELEAEKRDILDTLGECYEEVAICGTDGPPSKNIPVEKLSHSITRLARADLCVFAQGWEHSKECVIANDLCMKYDIPFALYADGGILGICFTTEEKIEARRVAGLKD